MSSKLTAPIIAAVLVFAFLLALTAASSRPAQAIGSDQSIYLPVNLRAWPTYRLAFDTVDDSNHKDIYTQALGSGETPLKLVSDYTQIKLNGLRQFYSWSPDAGRLAFTKGSDLYTIDASGANLITLTQTADIYEINPVWSPDGRWLAYIKYQPGGAPLMELVARDLQSQAEQFVTSGTLQGNFTWSPGSEFLTYSDNDAIWVYSPLRQANRMIVFDAANDGAFWEPQWSPDGSKLMLHYSQGLHYKYIVSISYSGDDPNLVSASVPVQLTPGASNYLAAWSPNSAKVAYINSTTLYVINSAGGSPTELTGGGISASFEDRLAWFGDQIIFCGQDAEGVVGLFQVNSQGGSLPVRLVTPGVERACDPVIGFHR